MVVDGIGEYVDCIARCSWMGGLIVFVRVVGVFGGVWFSVPNVCVHVVECLCVDCRGGACGCLVGN